MVVKIDEMSSAELALSYTKILQKVEKLEAQRTEIRKRIIEEAKKGISFKEVGLNISKRWRYDYTKCAESYEKKTGEKAPIRVIPAQEVLDVDLLKVLMKREGIKEGSESYTVARTKKKK